MPIIRVFRATIRPGMNSEFKDFFLNDACFIFITVHRTTLFVSLNNNLTRR